MTLPDSSALAALFRSQLSAWSDARARYDALNHVEQRVVTIGDTPFNLQHNPARAVSTQASIDPKAIAERPCFLCQKNRPAEQQGIAISKPAEFDLLVNPFPIFSQHFTVVSTTHQPQHLSDEALELLIGLAYEAPEYTFFYNGPFSGASAPDHLHLQGALDPEGFMTMPTAAMGSPRALLRETADGQITVADKLPQRPIVITAQSPAALQRLTRLAISCMPVKEGEAEPRMNLFVRSHSRELQCFIVGRDVHRPVQYAEGTMLCSPGAVDMAGGIILPRKSDYLAMDSEMLEDIIRQVRVSDEDFYQTILSIISATI